MDKKNESKEVEIFNEGKKLRKRNIFLFINELFKLMHIISIFINLIF